MITHQISLEGDKVLPPMM